MLTFPPLPPDFGLNFYVPVNNLLVMLGQVFLCWTSTELRITQHSDFARDEAWTSNP